VAQAGFEERVPTGRRTRRSFEKLVREVSAVLLDPVKRRLTIGEVAETLDEHPWRIVDALDAIDMMGGV
jgi:hypothetical protein